MTSQWRSIALDVSSVITKFHDKVYQLFHNIEKMSAIELIECKGTRTVLAVFALVLTMGRYL